MLGAPNVHSSDLEAARATSRRLRSGGDRSVEETPPFGFGPIAAREGEREPEIAYGEAVMSSWQAGAVSAELWETDNLGSRFWDELLGECLELSRTAGAIAAFAVDGQGLSIAQVGDMAPDAVEGTGSRLVIALEQAARMESFADRRLAALLVQFDDQWLTSMQLRSGSGSRVVVGVIAREPLPQSARDLVTHLLGEALLRG